MIAVSGASGNLGSSTVRHLLQRTDAARVLALSRTPHRSDGLGVRTRHGDFDEPDALVRALDGVERLLIISIGTDDRLPRHARAIDAAAKAGVGHVVFTSITRAGDPGHPNPLVPDYGATERLLAESGLPFTVLRFNVWVEMLTLVGVAPRAVATGVLPSNSRDGRIGHITRDDSAAVAAAVLAEGGSQGQILEVTGPQAVADADIAAALSEATGRRVRHEEVSDAVHPQRLLDQGSPSTSLTPGAPPASPNAMAGTTSPPTQSNDSPAGRPPRSSTTSRHTAPSWSADPGAGVPGSGP